MIIRRSQMRTFSHAVQEDLRCRLVTHVERVFAAQFARLGRHAVERRVTDVMKLAGEFGLFEEYDLCRMVDLSFLLDERIEDVIRRPLVKAILQDGALCGSEKMDRLYERLKELAGALGRQN